MKKKMKNNNKNNILIRRRNKEEEKEEEEEEEEAPTQIGICRKGFGEKKDPNPVNLQKIGLCCDNKTKTPQMHVV